MDKGQVVEFDTPANLIRNKSYFYDLVHRTGEENAQRLEKAAFLAEE